MNAFKKLQEVNQEKPYYGFSSLSIGYHKIVCFRTAKSKFTKTSNMVELKKEVLYLPGYFTENWSEEELNELNSPIIGESLYLFFGGQREKKGYVYANLRKHIIH